MSNDEGRIDETARKTADQFFVMYDTVEYAERERLAGLIETALAEQQAPAECVGECAPGCPICWPEPAAEVEADCNALLAWQWGKQMPEGMPDRLQRVIAAARRCAQAESERRVTMRRIERWQHAAHQGCSADESGKLLCEPASPGDFARAANERDALRERCVEAVRELRKWAKGCDTVPAHESDAKFLRDLADRLDGDK
jgi:hypothetical protein